MRKSNSTIPQRLTSKIFVSVTCLNNVQSGSRNSSQNKVSIYIGANANVTALCIKRKHKLSADEAEIIEDYIVKTNLIADHDCAFLYVQGAKDCVKLLKGLGAL